MVKAHDTSRGALVGSGPGAIRMPSGLLLLLLPLCAAAVCFYVCA